MRIVLKPLGALAILGAIILLALIAFRDKPGADTEPGRSPSDKSATVLIGKDASTGSDTLSVYTDGLENGWQERGWAKVVDYHDPSRVRGNGGTSIRVEAGPYEAVKMFHPEAVDMSPYRYFVCYVNGGDKGGQNLVLNTIAGGKNQGSVKFPPLPPKTWVRLSVPLVELDVQGRHDFNAFWIQNMAGEAAPAFFVDDVRFLVTKLPADSNPSLPFTKVQPAIPTTP